MRITSKGQVTIPVEIRDRAGMLPGTDVEFVVEGESVRLVKSGGRKETRGERAVRLLLGTGRFPAKSTDEIMKLLRGE